MTNNERNTTDLMGIGFFGVLDEEKTSGKISIAYHNSYHKCKDRGGDIQYLPFCCS
jgi:hypothetical protein